MHRLVIALTTLIGLTGAAYVAGHLFLFGGTATGFGELVPADTAVYLSVSLQPSSAQDAAISELVTKLPGFADAAALDQKLDELAQSLAAGVGLDYRRDVKPWLGDELSIAVSSGDDATSTVLAAVADRTAADEAVARLEADSGESFTTSTHAGVDIRAGETVAYAFVGETLVAGADAATVGRVIDVSVGAESLADREGVADALATLPADRLAVAYVDLEAVLADASEYPFAVGAIVADPGGLVASGRTGALDPDAAASASATAAEAAELPGWMPADTQLAFSAFDGAELLFTAESLLADVPAAEGITGTLDSVRALFAFGLGADLDDLLRELLAGEGALALRGLDTAAPSGLLLLRPDDLDRATARLDELVGLLTGAGGTVERTEAGGHDVVTVGLAGIASLSYAVADGVVLLGLDPDGIAAALAGREGGDTLADLDAYRGAFDLAGERTGNEIFMDPTVLLGLLGLGDGLPSDARDILAELGAFAVTIPDRGDHLEFHAVLTVE
jgi:hypothetical protein